MDDSEKYMGISAEDLIELSQDLANVLTQTANEHLRGKKVHLACIYAAIQGTAATLTCTMLKQTGKLDGKTAITAYDMFTKMWENSEERFMQWTQETEAQ